MKPLAERFWSRVDKNGPTMPHMQTCCWAWKAGLSYRGYGRFFSAGRTGKAHRVAWELHRGFIPVGMKVLHRCDNPPCVNPEHLFLGTVADNNADMTAKGRQRTPRGDRNGSRLHPERVPRGERQWKSKLTEEKVRSIFRLRAEGWTQPNLGAKFGITQTHVSAILSHKFWAHVQVEQGA